jgi:hypothetical protein
VTAHRDLRPLIEGTEQTRSGREGLLGHLRDCARCRAELAEQDPSLLFSLLALEPVPAEVLESVSRRAGAAIRRGGRPGRRRRAYAWGSLAASILGAGLLGAYFWGEGGEPPSPAGSAVVDAVPAPAIEAAIPAGMIELLESSGNADVVSMSVGEVEVVMIFDESMDI